MEEQNFKDRLLIEEQITDKVIKIQEVPPLQVTLCQIARTRFFHISKKSNK